MDRATLRELIDLLSPYCQTPEDRRALVALALGTSHLLVNQLNYNGTIDVFVINAAERLANSDAEPGKSGLWAVLEEVYRRVGENGQARIMALEPKVNARHTPPPPPASQPAPQSNPPQQVYTPPVAETPRPAATFTPPPAPPIRFTQDDNKGSASSTATREARRSILTRVLVALAAIMTVGYLLGTGTVQMLYSAVIGAGLGLGVGFLSPRSKLSNGDHVLIGYLGGGISYWFRLLMGPNPPEILVIIVWGVGAAVVIAIARFIVEPAPRVM